MTTIEPSPPKEIKSKPNGGKPRKVNYINNKTLFTAMTVHYYKLQDAIKNDTPKPQVTNYIGEALLKICSNLIRKGNFSGYSIQWKQEMVSDALMDCISAVDNFNPDKSTNPFAYFTQISWFAFLRRIQKEKKQSYIKFKNFENNYLTDENWSGESITNNDYSNEAVKAFEEKMLTKTKKNDNIIGIGIFEGDSDEK